MHLETDVQYTYDIHIPDGDIWVPQNQTVTVAGREIAGMIYLGERKLFYYVSRPYADSVIDPSLEVDNRSYFDFEDDKRYNYLPRYYDFLSDERAGYLDWLASDRSGFDCYEWFIRLYFYGLERRFFLDSPDQQESRAIITEVERLLERYENLDDFARAKREMSKFIYLAHAIVQPPDQIQPRFESTGREIPVDVRFAIGYRIENGQPLSSDWVLSWYATHPDSPKLRTAARRALPEFRALFGQLFEKKFPDGLPYIPLYSSLYSYYTSPSFSFTVGLSSREDIPDISTSFDVLPKGIGKIIDEAAKALNRYSRFLGKTFDCREAIEAHTLLPQSLRPLFPNAAIEELKSWAEKVVESGGLVPVERVVNNVDEFPPQNITKQHLTRAANTLALLSIGMVPDQRLELRGPKMGQPVVLFKLPEPATELQEVSSRYREAFFCILAGGFVAHADGRMEEKEKAALEAYVRSALITEPERDRLLAYLQWILSEPPTLAGIRRHLKHTCKDVPHKMGKLALSIAAVDGTIEPVKIKALEKLYKTICLPVESIYSDLHALSTPGGLRTIAFSAEKEQGFTVPPSNTNQPVVLDEKQISSLMAETAQVSAILGNIFEEEDVQQECSAELSSSEDVFEGLDVKHSAFLRELLTQRRWKKADYAALAGRFQLMEEGALEILNEWSFERFEDILIDEGADYELNLNLQTKLHQ